MATQILSALSNALRHLYPQNSALSRDVSRLGLAADPKRFTPQDCAYYSPVA